MDMYELRHGHNLHGACDRVLRGVQDSIQKIRMQFERAEDFRQPYVYVDLLIHV